MVGAAEHRAVVLSRRASLAMGRQFEVGVDDRANELSWWSVFSASRWARADVPPSVGMRQGCGHREESSLPWEGLIGRGCSKVSFWRGAVQHSRIRACTRE
jgi:hypothetical protein